jgi:acetyl-CoA acetyltransferase
MDAGHFKREIITVEIKTKKCTKNFDADEHSMNEANLEKLAVLPPGF